jgi:hypothetical protein
MVNRSKFDIEISKQKIMKEYNELSQRKFEVDWPEEHRSKIKELAKEYEALLEEERISKKKV